LHARRDSINANAGTSHAMEMKRLSGGNLRAAGYDDKNRVLVVELTSGTFQYAGVTAEMWRRFAGASRAGARHGDCRVCGPPRT